MKSISKMSKALLRVVLMPLFAFVVGVPGVTQAQSGDTWVAKQPPSYVNRSASIALNGKIYVFGSDDPSGPASSYSRVYDAVTDEWTTLAPMPIVVSAPAAATANGLIYVIGGYNPSNGATYDPGPNQVYDPSTNSWSVKSSPVIARSFAIAQAVEGKIYLVGGQNGTSPVLTVNEQYDPATDMWSTKAPMLTARAGMASAVVGGKIYVVGGNTTAGATEANEAYDPANNSWSVKASMLTGRGELGAAEVQGKIYTVGGSNTNINEAYDPSSDTWVVRAPIPVTMGGNTAAAVNGLVYAIGINRDQCTPQFGFICPPANYAYQPAVITIEVAIDIKPGSCPNPLNTRERGVLPAAILGTEDFDVSQVDVDTVKLHGVSPLRSSVEDVATPYADGISDPPDRNDCTTKGADGFTDLTLNFDAQEVVAALEAAYGPLTDNQVVVATLTGNLLDGTAIVGKDVVWIRKR